MANHFFFLAQDAWNSLCPVYDALSPSQLNITTVTAAWFLWCRRLVYLSSSISNIWTVLSCVYYICMCASPTDATFYLLLKTRILPSIHSFKVYYIVRFVSHSFSLFINIFVLLTQRDAYQVTVYIWIVLDLGAFLPWSSRTKKTTMPCVLLARRTSVPASTSLNRAFPT